jgi:hypothetical protein
MEVFLQIRRQKTTIFLTVKETATVKEVKAMLNGITNTAMEDICLFNAEEKVLSDDEKVLSDYGFLSTVCKAQQPGELMMVFKGEQKVVTPYSNPPEMPEVMRQDNLPQEQVAS